MKIALVCPYDYAYPGGVASHISQLRQQFINRGHQTTVIAPSAGKPPGFSDELGFVTAGRPVPIPVPGHGSVSRVSLSIWLRGRLREFLDKEQFDVVHLHEPLAPILPLMALQLSSAINVGTFHAFHKSNRLYWACRPALKKPMARLDGRIAVSKPARSYISKTFPGDYRIIPNGIDVDHFSQNARPFVEFQDGKFNILFVGRQEKRKGLKYLLAAYSNIRWQRPDVRLIVVGPGHPDSECQRIIAERRIEDVVFVGSVDYEELPRYYASAHVFCSPATGAESFGVILLEALASGTPVVATSIEGYASVVEDGQDAVLVPPRDEQSLAHAIDTVLGNVEMRQRLSSNGWAKVQQYRWDFVGKQVLDYYEELRLCAS